ncbi:MAG: DNA ligase (NAD(+)) LigA [Promethearchaeota archaeon]|nr:MAG: DNA ligase (NAD(+)) LigA [Candidatus Lokiarchaeota archaeon]
MTENQTSKDFDSKKEKIEYLVKEIQRHRDLYYNDIPEISDAKYDLLEDELRKLDPSNPILTTIGEDSSELFEKKEHIIPMGSQDKVTTPEDFLKWARKRQLPKYIIQFKLDGISIELQYDKGTFIRAVTRGDGNVGDDVSANVKKMEGFLPHLNSNFTGATRAEILLFHDIFEKKYSDKQNCRNAAAGIVRRKDGKGCEDLNLIHYDSISLDENVEFTSEINKLKWLKEEGFPTIKTKTVKTPQEVISVREEVMNKTRDMLEYDIDGLVIKGNKIDLEDMKRARPMKQIAFKFHAEEIETTLLDVEWSISGANYTPVAIVETVNLMGTNVSRASLANPNLIEELNLKIGSEVVISKRGDIIPKIERVIKTPPNAKDINTPGICEVCKTDLINEGTRLYCPNEECPKRQYHRITKWIKKLDIKHFSEKLMLKKLFDTGKVRKISDLYSLKVSDLTKFEGVKETSAKKALDNLYSVKEVPLAKFIAGFDVENIGERIVVKAVNDRFGSLEKIYNATIQDLSRVEGFAHITAKNLYDGLHKLYPDMVELLNTNKIKIKEISMSGKLEGKSFCFTGKLETMKRAEAEQIVIENGGEPKKSVVKDLSYLVTNETTPTAKYKKAQEQDTQIISEKEFLDMVK